MIKPDVKETEDYSSNTLRYKVFLISFTPDNTEFWKLTPYLNLRDAVFETVSLTPSIVAQNYTLKSMPQESRPKSEEQRRLFPNHPKTSKNKIEKQLKQNEKRTPEIKMIF